VGLIELLIRHPEEVETLRAMRAGGLGGGSKLNFEPSEGGSPVRLLGL
jgi:hypothetical protein